jgi:hypothetical protein
MIQHSSNNRTRLTHDYKAHVRAIQISTKRVFAYCEGCKNDPYLYSEMIKRSRPEQQNFYEIYRIEEITGIGGKPVRHKYI